MQTLQDIQVAQGAELVEINGVFVPASFDNSVVTERSRSVVTERSRSAEILDNWQTQTLLVDRSHWGKILVKDSDRLPFLHNQSSNNLQILKPGQGCDTVFLTSTARTVDLVSAYVLEDAVFLLTSANRCQQLLTNLDKYIFFADRVQLVNATHDYAVFSLVGEQSPQVLQQLGIDFDYTQPQGTHQAFTLGEISLRVAIGSGLAVPGYTLIIPAAQAPRLWQELSQLATPIGTKLWETLRILQGRPAADAELTEDYNPLEAGLWHTISFNKGCYIGQETIARLDTYKGVKQNLWGIHLTAPAHPGDLLFVAGEKVGKLTSYTQTNTGYFGLAYVRTKAGGAGLQVQVGDPDGEMTGEITGLITEVPFLSYDRSSP
ncbi:MAG: folate-binding protein YgfZ [Coleofasciculaceae cyanobacterium SM2_1_6]|nr:folate-binding protein YgfZ [Coleofasciculaceae cyanobacterium SM2_1_6]